MVCYYHVSTEAPSDGLFKLVIPTLHAISYMRASFKVTELSERSSQLLAKAKDQFCMSCKARSHCSAYGPCWLVAELLHSCDELQHRAQMFVEHLFEWERRENFSHLPSRFEVLFCWESLEDADWFRKKMRGGKGHIYLVSPVESDIVIHRGDQKWLDCLLESVQTIRKRARAYWNGKRFLGSGGGRWEMLVPCDLKVLDIIS